MGILSNLADKIAYKVNSATYDPEAEKFAKEQKERAEAEKSVKQAEEEKRKSAEQEKKDAETKAKEIEQKQKEADANATFSVGRLIGRVLGTSFSILTVLAIIGIGILGASFATNMNLYRDWPYRVLYLIYGFVFSPFVVAYVLLYRRLIKGKSPRFYSLLPLIPYKFENRWAARLFSWLCYKPDDLIDSQQEWKLSAT